MKTRKSLLISLFIITTIIFSQIPQKSWADTLYIWFSSWDGSSWSTPHVVFPIDYTNATMNSFQKTSWQTEEHVYFIIYFNLTDRTEYYTASSDGVSWSDPGILDSFGAFPLGGYDVEYPSLATAGGTFNGCFAFSGSWGAATYMKPFNCSGTSLTLGAGGASGGTYNATGISIASCLDGIYDILVYHSRRTDLAVNITRLIRTYAVPQGSDNSLPYGEDYGANVANQILRYKTSSPYHLLVIAKAGNQSFHYNLVNATDRLFIHSSFLPMNAVGGAGKNDFCAVSEAENIGDPEKVHFVFINSSGIFYMKFESDSWSSPAALGITEASYPTLNVDDAGNLLLTYVLSGSVKYSTKTPDGSWSSAQTLAGNYEEAAYCSSNHNIDEGEIILIFTAYYPETVAGELVHDHLVLAAAFMVSCFILVFIIHLVYALSSGKTDVFLTLLFNYIIGAIMIAGLAVVMLALGG